MKRHHHLLPLDAQRTGKKNHFFLLFSPNFFPGFSAIRRPHFTHLPPPFYPLNGSGGGGQQWPPQHVTLPGFPINTGEGREEKREEKTKRGGREQKGEEREKREKTERREERRQRRERKKQRRKRKNTEEREREGKPPATANRQRRLHHPCRISCCAQ